MSKHTPGPWYFSMHDQYGQRRFYIAQADGAPYTPYYSDVATVIAETCSGDLAEIQEANARLIAAAPDLLEALVDVMFRHVPFSNKADYAEKARAAIAKAEANQ